MKVSALYRLCVLVLVGACATTSTKLTVQRAPKISFKGMKTIALSITGECEELFRGPDRGPPEEQKALISIRLGERSGPLIERRMPCTDPSVLQGAERAIFEKFRERLTAQNYSVVPANEGTPDLHVHLKLARLREAKEGIERKDREGDSTCQKRCGVPACRVYNFKFQLQVDASIHGPNLPGAGEQKVVISQAFNAIRLNPGTIESGAIFGLKWGADAGTDNVTMCHPDQARSYAEDDKHFNWDQGSTYMVTWLEQNEFGPLLSPYNEEVRLSLFNVKGSRDNEQGLKAVKENNFYLAFKSFNAALRNNPEANGDRARVLYNAAAAKMQLGDLKLAEDFIQQSLDTHKTDEGRALQQEIARRLVDNVKM